MGHIGSEPRTPAMCSRKRKGGAPFKDGADDSDEDPVMVPSTKAASPCLACGRTAAEVGAENWALTKKNRAGKVTPLGDACADDWNLWYQHFRDDEKTFQAWSERRNTDGAYKTSTDKARKIDLNHARPDFQLGEFASGSCKIAEVVRPVTFVPEESLASDSSAKSITLSMKKTGGIPVILGSDTFYMFKRAPEDEACTSYL